MPDDARDGRVPEPDLLANILGRARDWERTQEPGVVSGRVAAGVRPYLGPRATDRIIGSSPQAGRNLLSTLEPVLVVFLGARAAGQLVTHVLDRSIVRA